MKHCKRTAAAVAALLACSLLAAPVSAHSHQAGWGTQGAGRQYIRQNGSPATGLVEIDGHTHRFDSNGMHQGLYSGWATDTDRACRHYYQNGVRCTGWLEQGGKHYYFNRDGVLRTGWTAVEGGGYANIYYFGEDGVWDGKEGASPQAYRPQTMGDFLLDFDYPANGTYDAKLGQGEFREFSGIEAVLSLLEKQAHTPLVHGSYPSDDEVEFPEGILTGRADIMIRRRDLPGGQVYPALHFSLGEDGNCYFYSTYYNFGIKLEDSQAYNMLLQYMRAS